MPVAEPAPPRGPLSKLRRNKGLADASTTSFSASIDGDDSSESGGGLRASMDGAVEKLKEKATRRKTGDDRSAGEDDGGSRRLTKLLSRPRNKKDGPSLQRSHSGDLGSGSMFGVGSRSQTSLLDDSGHSSLLTDDNSDIEGRPRRPTLSPHQSHSGLLTLTSPDINAQTRPVATPSSTSPNGSASSIPQILEPTKSSSLLPPTRSARRSPSPSRLGKLFRPRSIAGSVNSQAPPEAEDPTPEESVPQPEVSSLTQLSPAPPEKSVQGLAPIEAIESVEQRAETPSQPPTESIITTSLPATPPNFVETPTTLITPPTPTDPSRDSGTFPDNKLGESSPNRRLNSVESIRHRRAQSANLPSKLSHSIPAPLTPTIEETKTPGGTFTQPTSATGFFSSFFSAAQKAADQLSSNINNSGAGHGKSKGIADETVEGGEEAILGTKNTLDIVEGNLARRPATETLGKGNLSLSQLGIAEDDESSPMSSAVDLPKQNHTSTNGDGNKKAEEEAAARAVSVAYEKPVQNAISQAMGRPNSVASTDRLTLEQTPPRSGADPLQRSGSVRSKLSGRRRRHRASSATTGTDGGLGTLAAAIKSSSAAIANPATGGVGHRLTGFAVASNKRNKDFHSLFRSVPEDDYLIEDYSAALQKDILLHGRLYVSEGHICFSSNILGWVTNLVISFDEVVSVEKKSTAVIFPNAIVIQTLQARHTFASFVARDSTYELLIGIWKISHPNLKSSLNGVTLDNAGTGDKTEVADPEASDIENDGSDDEVYDEDDEDDAGSFTDAGKAPSVAGSDLGDHTLSRKASGMPLTGPPQTNGVTSKAPEAAENEVSAASGGSGAPGPQAHAPTECSDQAVHYDRPLTDTTIPAPLGKIYSLIYGPESGTFMRRWFVDDQKSRDLNWSEKYLSQDNKTVIFDYIKPINAPVGPKQTKCITTNTLIDFDLEKAVTVDCSTATPDVPSGGAFTTKTRYCLMWGPNNSTRMIANCMIEWTGKSWLKGPIEKGANDGQIEYVKALVAALKAAVSTKAPIKGANGKKLKRKGTRTFEPDVAVVPAAVAAEAEASNWGPLEPVHQIFGALTAIVRPFVTSETIIAVLLCLLMYTWMTQSRGSTNPGVGKPAYTSPERLAAYEEIWRREESELWNWLEDRTGVGNIYAKEDGLKDRQKVLRAREMRGRLEDEAMSGRQMDDAIRLTEEKLEALKEAVARKKGKGEKKMW